jgi:hypothetical protein
MRLINHNYKIAKELEIGDLRSASQIPSPRFRSLKVIMENIMSRLSHGWLATGGLVMVSLGLLISESVKAQERPFFQASRALAMGDAYTAVGSGYESVYYNPAGITYRAKAQFKPLDLETAVSTGFTKLFSGDLTKLTSMQGVYEKIIANPDKPFSVGVNFLPQFLIKNFSVGLVARAFTQSEYHSASSDADFHSYADVGAYVQYAASLAGGLVRIGVGGKILDRADLNQTFTAAQLAGGSVKFSNQWNEGLGYGFDVGALFTIPVAGLPTLGVSVMDVGNTRFNQQKLLFASSAAANSSPSSIRQRVNVGLSGILKHSKEVRSVLSIEAKDVTEISGWTSFQDHFHAGWELDLNRFVMIRAGCNQGRYWTAGLALQIESVMLEFTTYGENISTTGGREDDRKWMGRYAVTF